LRFPLAVLPPFLIATAASAGAWPLPPGETLVIVKYEDMRADAAFDAFGRDRPAPRREDRELSAFVEHGLTKRLTFQGKLSWQRGEDDLIDYDGRGPVEVGLRYAVIDRLRWKVSVYGGVAAAGQGRNAGYAEPGEGEGDAEVRLLIGRDAELPRRLGGLPYFNEVQVARLNRAGLPDEVRFDSTSGVRAGRGGRWLLLWQTYAGWTDGDAAEWSNVEASVVRDLGGGWSVQAGWREAAEGRNTPKASGPVLGVWRRF
jgi:hypothetical protein